LDIRREEKSGRELGKRKGGSQGEKVRELRWKGEWKLK
jgi:hypothetical protein